MKFIKKVFFMILIITALWGISFSQQPANKKGKNLSFQEIKKKGVIIIGISKKYPPLNFSNNSKGVEIKLSKELGEFLQVKVRFVKLDVSEYIPAILSGRVNIVIAALSQNLSRGQKIWFSKSYLSLTPGVLIRKKLLPQQNFSENFEQPPVETLWDLKRLQRFSFAVKEGSSYEYLLKNEFPSTKRVLVKTNQQGLKLLKNGKVDAFIHDSLYMQYLYEHTSSLQSRYKLLKGGSREEKISIGLPFGNIILKNQIDFFISEIKRLKKIQKWLSNIK